MVNDERPATRTSSTRRGAAPERVLRAFVLLGGLWSLALLPLFELLRRQPEFLSAQGLSGWSLVLFVTAIWLGGAVALSSCALVCTLFLRQLRLLRQLRFLRLLHSPIDVGVVVVGSLPVLLFFSRITSQLADGWLALVLSLVLTIAAAVTLYRSKPLGLAAWLIPALLAPPLWLSTSASVRSLVVGDRPISGSAVEISEPVPIVLLILDELPIASLIDATGETIDGHRFPGFARLAEESLWFRNATTVADNTLHAVPSVLTGKRPQPQQLARYSDHPENLLVWLGGTYDVRAAEPLTQLCPPSICQEQGRSDPLGLTLDTSVILGHLVLPPSFRAELPDIRRGWGNFWRPPNETLWSSIDPTVDFFELIDELRRWRAADVAPQRPRFWMHHLVLPHAPWRFLPDGSEYVPLGTSRPPPGYSEEGFATDWAARLALQMYQAQLAYLDTLILSMLEAMEESGLWDEALVVVAADHGIVFAEAVPPRMFADEATQQDLVRVPLFLKVPGLEPGVRDVPVETIDVPATVAEVLGEGLPWESDGSSLLSGRLAEAADRYVLGWGPEGSGRVVHEISQDRDRKALGLVEERGDLSVPVDHWLYRIAPGGWESWIGARFDESIVEPTAVATLTLDRQFGLRASEGLEPALYTGLVDGFENLPDVIAATHAGVVCALTEPIPTPGGRGRIQMLLPPRCREGAARDALSIVAGYEPATGTRWHAVNVESR